MLKSLFPQVEWDTIKIIGFDLDGTLYDEMDFIFQVYKPISEILAKYCNFSSESIFRWMLNRWLQKGSSYNLVFTEVLDNHGIRGNTAEAIVAECISLFRGYSPELDLSVRVSIMLDWIKANFRCFLVTDGNFSLQMSKIKALGLEQWFNFNDIGVCGFYGAGFEKPSTRILDNISVLKGYKTPVSVVYFGDRDIDRQFAETAGFQFIRVKVMFPVTIT